MTWDHQAQRWCFKGEAQTTTPTSPPELGQRQQAVDVSPLHLVNQAIRLLCTGSPEASFQNNKTIAECLADELISVAKGSSNSYTIKKKDELEYRLQIAFVSEKFIVTGLTRPVLTPLGGTLEISCQLSPPQHAQHMEIRWFRNHYTQPVYLYRDGKDLHGETISKYVERTELLKDPIGKGKVTLRIFNVTVDDDGPYRCFFKDGEFYEEHITEVKVTVTSSDIQILMHSPNTKGVMLECHSGGWFPQPHMEWRNSKGEIIPATSKSHSQDGNKLFNMTMALFIEANSHRNVTCYFQNCLTHQEESISIVLSGELFSWKCVWMWIMSMIASVLIAFLVTYCVQQYLIYGNCSERFSYLLKGSVLLMTSVLAIMGVILILHLKQRVTVSDPRFELDTLWLEDISVILCMLIGFIIKLVSFIYFRL
ncbi:selection and upkeep of intraepithelial T-cells protein 2-like [Peromyscus californicus insignis]|uniref:selection and upkeep of intraepithelial T-cells protein 2-like n=1 Tax=Peromyscus californicus insignis TaxID=564181 RepID=UPI0022A6B1E3|nr:selection and upkeep of intraepithelial T-cells protein 2-like [Peromyscus californicus insignis]